MTEYEEWLDTKELRKLIGKEVKVSGVERTGHIVSITITKDELNYQVEFVLPIGGPYIATFSREHLEFV